MADTSFTTEEPDSLEWRHSNFGRVLNNALTRFEGRIIEIMEHNGHTGINRSCFALLRNLELQGLTTAELARRAGVRKHPMGGIVTQCEKLGLVVRDRDDRDRRGKIVKFSDTGLRCLRDFHSAVICAEIEMSNELGILNTEVIAWALRAYGERRRDSKMNGADGLCPRWGGTGKVVHT